MSKRKNVRRNMRGSKTSTTKTVAVEHRAVMSAQGTWCISGAARSNIVKALARLRTFPPDVSATLGPELPTTAAALEAALSSLAPLELATYYELVASFEETMARTMQTLLDMAPADDMSPSILLSLHIGLARAECFRHFAAIPPDVSKAKEFLLPCSGTYAQLRESLLSNGEIVLPEEAKTVVLELEQLASDIATRDPNIAAYARQLAALLNRDAPLPLATFLEKRAELARRFAEFNAKYVFKCDDLLTLTKDPRLIEMRDGVMGQLNAHAFAATACEFLATIYRPRPRATTDDDSPIILN